MNTAMGSTQSEISICCERNAFMIN